MTRSTSQSPDSRRRIRRDDRPRRGSAARADVTLIDARPEFVQRIRLHEMLAGGAPKLWIRPRLGGAESGSSRPAPRAWSPDGSVFWRGARMGAASSWATTPLILALGSAQRPGSRSSGERRPSGRSRQDPGGGRRVRALAGSGGRALVVAAGSPASRPPPSSPSVIRAARHLATRGRVGEAYFQISRAGMEHLRKRLAGLGVSILDGAGIQGLESGRAWREDGGAIDFDLCVWAARFEASNWRGRRASPWTAPARDRRSGPPRGRPPEPLRGRGLRGGRGFSDSNAAGGRALRMGCVSALPLGAHAGGNVLRLLRGEDAVPLLLGFAIRCISLGRKDGLVQFVEPATLRARRSGPTAGRSSPRSSSAA